MSFPDKMTLHRKLGKKKPLSKCAVVTFHLSSLFTMASVQKSVDAYKTMHHDHQQLVNVSSVLMDCTQKLNDTKKSRKEIAKLTKLSLDALDVVSALVTGNAGMGPLCLRENHCANQKFCYLLCQPLALSRTKSLCLAL
jgi:hypothetical protein